MPDPNHSFIKRDLSGEEGAENVEDVDDWIFRAEIGGLGRSNFLPTRCKKSDRGKADKYLIALHPPRSESVIVDKVATTLENYLEVITFLANSEEVATDYLIDSESED